MKMKSVLTIGALILSLSGCVFGNHTINGPVNNPLSGILGDTTSGYYATEPQTYQVSATVGGTTTTEDASISYLPSQISTQFSNPIAFKVDANETDVAELFDPLDEPDGFQFTYNAGNTFDFSGTWTSAPLWDSTLCTLTQNLTLQGEFEPLGTTSTTETLDGNVLPITGRMTMSVQIQYSISGSTCTNSLQEMYNCYQDVTTCMGTDANSQLGYQQIVDSLFNPFIQSGAMTPADIQTVTGMTAQIQYQ
jgi:hypothetical protein